MKRTINVAAKLLLGISTMTGLATAAESAGTGAIAKAQSAKPTGSEAHSKVSLKLAQAALFKKSQAYHLARGADLATATDLASRRLGEDAVLLAAAAAVQPRKIGDSALGVGGPFEAADELDPSTPPVAVDNYPPCSPGPGDDRCIQLYEPGVRARLAGWSRPTGGLSHGSETIGVGGPFEPLEESNSAAPPVVKEAGSATSDGGTVVALHSNFSGVGGPIEAQSGYPPCSPGPGDDSCIQLYEPGVTGRGN